MKLLLFFLSVGILSAGDLRDLESSFTSDGPFVAGKLLTKLKPGIHYLDDANNNQRELIISVHGWKTKGFEWVYPLIELDKEENRIAFFRWNTSGCPNKATEELYTIINAQAENYQKITLIGHSYGGIILAKLLNRDFAKQLEMHIVASGISGDPRLNSFCGYRPPNKISSNITAFHWMTQKHLDGSFKDLKTDTQIQKIRGVSAIRLPEEYKGNTLSHNRSISWLVDFLNSN
jgi:hypothetical protein